MTPTTGTKRATIETAALDRTRRRLAQFFIAHAAITPEDAIHFNTTSASDERVFRRMCRAGLIRDAGRRRFYLDLVAYQQRIDRRRRLGMALAGLIILAMGLLLALLQN